MIKKTPKKIETLEDAARDLYRRCTTGSAPSWERIGETTKSVWRERVKNGDKGPSKEKK